MSSTASKWVYIEWNSPCMQLAPGLLLKSTLMATTESLMNPAVTSVGVWRLHCRDNNNQRLDNSKHWAIPVSLGYTPINDKCCRCSCSCKCNNSSIVLHLYPSPFLDKGYRVQFQVCCDYVYLYLYTKRKGRSRVK